MFLTNTGNAYIKILLSLINVKYGDRNSISVCSKFLIANLHFFSKLIPNLTCSNKLHGILGVPIDLKLPCKENVITVKFNILS